MINVVIINNVPASESGLAAALTPTWLDRCATALTIQLLQHVAPYWAYALDSSVRVGSGPADLEVGDNPCNIIASAGGGNAEAWHDDELNGVPDAFLVLDQCRSLDDATSGMSHEFCEIAGNPQCVSWVTAPSGIVLPSGLVAGKQIAHEISDPVQDRGYTIDLGDGQAGIYVSDFVLPAYFDLTLTGPTTYGEAALGLPRVDPFGRTDGGYQIARNPDGTGEADVFGAEPRWSKLARARSRPRRIRHHGRQP